MFLATIKYVLMQCRGIPYSNNNYHRVLNCDFMSKGCKNMLISQMEVSRCKQNGEGANNGTLRYYCTAAAMHTTKYYNNYCNKVFCLLL